MLQVWCDETMIQNIEDQFDEKLQINFNGHDFDVAMKPARATCHLIDTMIDDDTKQIFLNQSQVSINTFRNCISIFKSGLIQPIHFTSDMIVELLILADYLQSDLLLDFTIQNFHDNAKQFATSSKFNMNTLPDRIFLKIIKGIPSKDHLELWSQYCWCIPNAEHTKIKVPEEWRTELRKIDLCKSSLHSLEYALKHMHVDVMQELSPQGLMMKLCQVENQVNAFRSENYGSVCNVLDHVRSLFHN